MGEVFAIGALALVGFLLWDNRPSVRKRWAEARLAEAAEEDARIQRSREQTKRVLAAREEARKAREHEFMIANKGYGKVLDEDDQKIEAVMDENYPKVSDFYERLAEEGIELHTSEAYAAQFAWWQEKQIFIDAVSRQGFSR